MSYDGDTWAQEQLKRLRGNSGYDSLYTEHQGRHTEVQRKSVHWYRRKCSGTGAPATLLVFHNDIGFFWGIFLRYLSVDG